MKLTMNRAELLSAARRGENIAPKNSALDVLKGLLLETESPVSGTGGTLTMTATNMEVALEQKLPCEASESDAFVLNAQLAVEMLERLGGDTVTLEHTHGRPQLHLSSGDAEYLVPVWERASYPKPEIPFPEDTVKVSGIPGMARRTVFAAAKDDNKPLMKCVNLKFTRDGLRAVVGNGSCIVTAKGDEKSTGDISLLVPALSLEKLARLCSDKDEFRVGSTGKAIVFLKENFTYSARLLEEEYIDVERLIGGVQSQFTVLTGIAELKKALELAACVGAGGKVCLRFGGNRLTFHCRSENGNTTIPLDVIPLTGAPQGEFWYLSERLMSCLKALAGTVKLGVAQGGMLTLEAEDAYYLQTGVRPPAAVEKAEKKEKKKKKAPAKKAA